MYTSKEYWVWLTIAFGPANSRKWNAVSHYGSCERTYEKISSGDYSRVLPGDLKTVKAANIEQARKLIKFCDSKGIGICDYDDPDFPERLKDIYNPPSVLFYLGDISDIDDTVIISAVGTRTPSAYSVAVTEKICSELAKDGVAIASGFAVGLDSVAHNSAIKAGGRTYAVLPCGILHEYPHENAGKKPVIAKHGAVISEYLPSERPSPIYFRARNRILSGIGLGTLVTQANEKSGSLSTASFALSQGRDIFCIPPHELFNKEYFGQTELIRDGAIPVFDASDIINEYKDVYPHKLKSDRTKIFKGGNVVTPGDKPTVKRKNAAKEPTGEEPQDRQISAPKTGVPAYFNEINDTKKKIYDIIRENKEMHFDDLAVGIGDIYELEALLTELELDGHIISLPGNRFVIRQ